MKSGVKNWYRGVASVVEWITQALHYAFLSRVPLLGLGIFLALPWLALNAGRSLVIGAYDVNGFLEALMVGCALSACCGSIHLSARIMLEQGRARFSGLVLPEDTKPVLYCWRFLLLTGWLCNAGVVLRVSASSLTWELVKGLLLGMILAFAVYFATRASPTSPRKTPAWRSSLARRLKRDHPIASHGYVVKTPGGGLDIANGMVTSVINVCVNLTVLGLFLYFGYEGHLPPALASVMLVLCLVVFVMSSLAFLLDYIRVPVFVVMVLIFAGMSIYRKADHYYEITTATTDLNQARPGDVLMKAIRERADKPVVVVAAAGGGIQATAWTAAVLAKIDEEIGDDHAFSKSVRLVSGVSGGAVGAVLFAHACEEPDKMSGMVAAAKTSSLSAVLLSSLRTDFLRTTAPFMITDGNIFNDRGKMLEETFETHLTEQHMSPLKDETLGTWQTKALNLKMPAVICSATAVETGERMAFSTIPCCVGRDTPGKCEFTERYRADLPVMRAARLSATFPFASPAARPALDPEAGATDAWKTFHQGGNSLHLVDGGYFDVSAVVGAVEWLDDALTQREAAKTEAAKTNETAAAKPAAADQAAVTQAAAEATGGPKPEAKKNENAKVLKVLFLEINPFPKPPDRNDIERDHLTVEKTFGYEAMSHGTLYDLGSPLLAVYQTRGSAQHATSSTLIHMLTQRWAGRDVEITHVKIFYPIARVKENEKEVEKKKKDLLPGHVGVDPKVQPLSWHLREEEKQDLDQSVQQFLDDKEGMPAIRNFFPAAKP
ncbi:patatin-like phospholipase family protein [Prosthecobacter sp.]|uniref:patatin-like phospholipase family protein n=1 Tax=Prosthecobacter sp. TaxID=1965333 RepID=UPI003784A582